MGPTPFVHKAREQPGVGHDTDHMSDLLLIPPFSQRLATRDISAHTVNRLSLTVALGTSALLFALLFLMSPNSITPPSPLLIGSVLGLLVVCCISGLLTGVVLWSEATFARLRGSTSRLRFLMFYVIGGALVGVALETLLPLTGFISLSPAPVRIFSIAVIAAWMGAAIGATHDGRRRVRVARRVLVEQAAAVVLSGTSQSALIEQLRNQLHTDLEASLKPTFDRTLQKLAAETQIAADDLTSSAAQVLQELTDESVRPVSRKLDDQTAYPRERHGVVAFIAGVARHKPFHPLAVAAIFLLAGVSETWILEGFNSALLSASLGVALIFAILGAGNRLMAAFPKHHTVIFVATFIVLQIPTIVVEAATERDTAYSAVVVILFGILISGCIVWLTSGIGQWRTAQAELLNIYADELNTAKIELLAQAEVLRSITKQAARLLHGSVQSKLTACILALDRAANSDDVQAYTAAINQATSILSQPWPLIHEAPMTSTLEVVVSEKVALWQGLAGIGSFISPEVKQVSGRSAHVVGDIVEEAVCNAIRHGRSDTISVQIDLVTEEDSAYARIRVVDDGIGLGGGGPGLGTVYLNETCADRWTRLEVASGGCSLEAWVPLGGG